MRALSAAAAVLVSLVLLAIAYLFAAGRYGMSDRRYSCVGQLLTEGRAAEQTLNVRIQEYRWWMHWIKRGGIVWVERPSFIAYPPTYLHSYTKLERSDAFLKFGTGIDGAREGRLSLVDMSLNIENMHGTKFSGVCSNL